MYHRQSEKFDHVKVGRDEGELREEGSGPPEGQDAEHPAPQHCRHKRILLFYHIVTYKQSLQILKVKWLRFFS
jgi:hypothetical protein